MDILTAKTHLFMAVEHFSRALINEGNSKASYFDTDIC